MDPVISYLVRHGRTVWNAEARFQGQAEAELDDLGRAQAERAAARLALVRPSRLVSSDLRRCLDTAMPVASAAGLAVEMDSQLREIDVGCWEGLTRAEVAERWPEEAAAWRRGEDIPRGGGETYRQLRVRVWGALERIVAESLASPEEGPVVIMTHGGAIRAAVAEMLQLPGPALAGLGSLANAAFTVFEAGTSGTRLLSYNDTGHLTGLS